MTHTWESKLKFAMLAAVALLCIAAVTPNSFVAPQTPNRGIVQFLQGTDVAGTYKTLYTSSANGSRCYSMFLTSTDPSPHLVTIQLVNSAVKYGGVALTTGSTSPGFLSAAPALTPMSQANWPGLPLDANGNNYIQMISGDTLQATYATNLQNNTVINLVATCADF